MQKEHQKIERIDCDAAIESNVDIIVGGFFFSESKLIDLKEYCVRNEREQLFLGKKNEVTVFVIGKVIT